MPKIILNKEKLEVTFRCRNKREMEYVLDVYIKGNEKIMEEAKKEIENLD